MARPGGRASKAPGQKGGPALEASGRRDELIVRAWAMSVPRIVVVLPLEGRTRAHLDCATYEEERRLAHDLARRDLLDEIIDALLALFAALESAA
jgi:hypothetical protein